MPRCAQWCSKCYSNNRGRSNYAGHSGYRARPRQVRSPHVGALSKRSGRDGGDGRGVWIVGDGMWENNHPELYQFLSAARYPDGGDRRTGTMLIFTDQGTLKMCLSDRDQSLVAFLTGDSLDGLLDAAEAGLREDALEWRVARQDGARKPHRRS